MDRPLNVFARTTTGQFLIGSLVCTFAGLAVLFGGLLNIFWRQDELFRKQDEANERRYQGMLILQRQMNDASSGLATEFDTATDERRECLAVLRAFADRQGISAKEIREQRRSIDERAAMPDKR